MIAEQPVVVSNHRRHWEWKVLKGVASGGKRFGIRSRCMFLVFVSWDDEANRANRVRAYPLTNDLQQSPCG